MCPSEPCETDWALRAGIRKSPLRFTSRCGHAHPRSHLQTTPFKNPPARPSGITTPPTRSVEKPRKRKSSGAVPAPKVRLLGKGAQEACRRRGASPFAPAATRQPGPGRPRYFRNHALCQQTRDFPPSTENPRPAPLDIRKPKNQYANSICQQHPPRLRESKMLGVLRDVTTDQ